MSNEQIALQLTQQTVYLMGICFILGSLTTIFILLILDMVRRGRPPLIPDLFPETRDDKDTAVREADAA